MSIGDFIRGSQIWKSIFRHPAPRDRRNRVVVMLTNVFLHLHPVSVRKSGIALSYTWCMGGLTFFLFLVDALQYGRGREKFERAAHRKSLVRPIFNLFAVSGVERGHTDSAADSRLYRCNPGCRIIFPGYCTCREES